MTCVTIDPGFLARQGVPADVAQTDARALSIGCSLHGINTPDRLAHLCGQIMHEANRGRDFSELPSRFASSTWRYKGRGWPQLTTEGNYRGFRDWCRANADTLRRAGLLEGEVPDFLAQPHRVEEAPWRVLAATWYWEANNANRYADAGVTSAAVRNITARVWRPHRDAYHTQRRLEYAQRAKRLVGQYVRFRAGSDLVTCAGNLGAGFPSYFAPELSPLELPSGRLDFGPFGLAGDVPGIPDYGEVVAMELVSAAGGDPFDEGGIILVGDREETGGGMGRTLTYGALGAVALGLVMVSRNA